MSRRDGVVESEKLRWLERPKARMSISHQHRKSKKRNYKAALSLARSPKQCMECSKPEKNRRSKPLSHQTAHQSRRVSGGKMHPVTSFSCTALLVTLVHLWLHHATKTDSLAWFLRKAINGALKTQILKREDQRRQ